MFRGIKYTIYNNFHSWVDSRPIIGLQKLGIDLLLLKRVYNFGGGIDFKQCDRPRLNSACFNFAAQSIKLVAQ